MKDKIFKAYFSGALGGVILALTIALLLDKIELSTFTFSAYTFLMYVSIRTLVYLISQAHKEEQEKEIDNTINSTGE